MKRFLAPVLALAMCCVMAVPVFAEDTVIDQSAADRTAKTTVDFCVDPTYTVTIPESVEVDFNATKTQFGSIKLEQAQIDPDKQIVVSVAAGEALVNLEDHTKTLPYTIEDGNGKFTSAAYFAEGDETALTINIAENAWNAAYAGDYSDTVTFTVSYADKA